MSELHDWQERVAEMLSPKGRQMVMLTSSRPAELERLRILAGMIDFGGRAICVCASQAEADRLFKLAQSMALSISRSQFTVREAGERP